MGRSASAWLAVRCPVSIGALGAVADVSPVGAAPQPPRDGCTCCTARDPRAGPSGGVAKPLLKVGVVVAGALSMPCVVLPVFDTGTPIDVDAAPPQLMRLPPHQPPPSQ